jgi:hypothetical protein
MGIRSTLGKNLSSFLSVNNTSDIGTTADNVLPILASGGTGITTTGKDGKVTNYHVFTEPGHFRLGPAAVGTGKTFTVLVVAGGGSGGGAYYAGGGGAGEVVYGAAVTFDQTNGYEYKVDVGEGGIGVFANGTDTQYHTGVNGGDSRFYPTLNYTSSRLNDKTVGIVTNYLSNVGLASTGVIALGGGGGGSYSGVEYMAGNHGGSAGGGSQYITTPVYPARYTKTGGRGYDSQYIYRGTQSDPGGSVCHGGGGAGAVGADNFGGPGYPFDDFGDLYVAPAIPAPVRPSWIPEVNPGGLYGGGGGGAEYGMPEFGAGGTGGGGNGGNPSMDGAPAVDYTGGGGGGQQVIHQNSGSGGKGIVIIKYINPSSQ